MADATTGGIKSFLANGLTAPFRYIARFQKWVADTVPKLPGYHEVNTAATQVTWPLRTAADFAVRKVPGVKRFEWLLETQRLSVYPPILLALTLLFVLWRGLKTTNLGHIGTDLLIFPTLSSISVFNPFLGLISGLCFSIGDILQKLVINDMYATPRGMFVKYGSLDYWGAIAGYMIGSSALMLMGLAPGITSRLFRQGTRLALRKIFYRQAMAAADGARPPDGGFGVRVFVRKRPDGTLDYQAGARTPGPGWEPHTGPMSKEEASALLERVRGESVPSDRVPTRSGPDLSGPGQVSSTGSTPKSDWTRPSGIVEGETRRYSPWHVGATDPQPGGFAGPGMVKGEGPDWIKGAISPTDGPRGGMVDGGIRRHQTGPLGEEQGTSIADRTTKGPTGGFGPGQISGAAPGGKGDWAPAVGGGFDDGGIRRYQPGALANPWASKESAIAGLGDRKGGAIGDLKSVGLGETKATGLSDLMKGAGLTETKGAGLSEMKGAGVAETKAAGLSDVMKGAGLGETKSAGLSEMKSAGLGETKAAGLSDLMKGAGLGETKVAGLNEMKGGDPWGKSDLPFDQPPVAPPSPPPPSAPPRRRRPPVPPPPAAYVPPPVPSDVPVDPQPMPSPRRRPQEEDPLCGLLDEAPPMPPMEIEETVCPPLDLDDLDDVDGPGGPGDRDRNRSPYDSNDGLPVYPIAEMLASIAGAIVGAATGMLAAPSLVRAAFEMRPHPDISCFQLEANTYMRGRAGEVGLEAGLGGNVLENAVKRPPGGGGSGGGLGKAGGLAPPGLSQEEAAALRSRIEKAEETYAFLGNKALQDRKTELKERLEAGEFVDQAEVDRLLKDAGVNLAAYNQNFAQGTEEAIQRSHAVRDAKNALEKAEDDEWTRQYDAFDALQQQVIDGKLNSVRGLEELDEWHDRVIGSHGRIDVSQLDAMAQAMKAHRRTEIGEDFRLHVAAQQANERSDYWIRVAQNTAIVGLVAVPATMAGAMVGTGALAMSYLGWATGMVTGGAMSYMDGGRIRDGAKAGAIGGAVLGPLFGKLFQTQVLRNVNPTLGGATLGAGTSYAMGGDPIEGAITGGFGGKISQAVGARVVPPPGWGGQPAVPAPAVPGSRRAVTMPGASPRNTNWKQSPRDLSEPAPPPRTGEPDYLGVHNNERGPHYEANQRILEGLGGDDLIGPRGSRVSDDTIFTGQPKEDFNTTRPGGSRATDDTIATGPFKEDLNQTRTSTPRRPPADDPFANDSLEQLRYNEQLARQAGDGEGAEHFADLIRQRVAAGDVDAPRGIRPSASDVDAMGGDVIPEPVPGSRSIKPSDVPEPGPAPKKSSLPNRPDALDWSEFQGPREDALPEFRSKVPDRQPRNPFEDGLPPDATRRGIDPADDPRLAKAPSDQVANRTRSGSEFEDGTPSRSSSTREHITSRDQGTSSQRNVTGREDGGTSPRNVTANEGEVAPLSRNTTANEGGTPRQPGRPAPNPDDLVVTGQRPTQEQMDNLFRTRSDNELIQAQHKALADGDQKSAMMLQHVLEAKGHRPVIDPELIPPKLPDGELPNTRDIEALAKQFTERQLRAASDAATDPHQKQILDQAADTRWGMAKEGTGVSWQPPEVRNLPRDIPKPHFQKSPELTQIPTEMPAPGLSAQTVVEGGGPRVPSRPIVDPLEPQPASSRRVVPAAEESDLPPLKPAPGRINEGEQVLPKAEGTHHANEGGYSAEALARMQQNRFFRRTPDGKLIEINDPSAIDQQAFGRDVIVQVDKTTGQQTVTSWGDRIQPTERTGIRARLNEELGQPNAARPPVGDDAAIESAPPRATRDEVAEPQPPARTEEPVKAPRDAAEPQRTPAGDEPDGPPQIDHGDVDPLNHNPNLRATQQERDAFREGYKHYDREAHDVQEARLSDPVLAAIPEEEIVALRGYLGDDYMQINPALRGNDAAALEQLGPQIKNAVSALNQMPGHEQPITVYRGTDLPDHIAAKYTDGEIVTEQGFTSTTAKAEKIWPGDTEFVIQSKNGKYVEKITACPGEEEVVFPPGTKFRVLKTITETVPKKIGQGTREVRRIFMEEV